MTIARLLIALALLATAGVPAYAQVDQGRLTGVVIDNQRAILPGVTVTANHRR